ncbi:hypothetical protein D3Y57_08710 [Sphingomonas paeninsulae]|jgi:hypothetical protein|uniref:Uncharacterized protein n=1 Tax=Sphingomonas paeninsulae TaxID=2319844 RepID=A0A494TFA9_SPHPE|nr:hypothetical protein [Sphingomonas paeninsulae]AYJ86034.1 hypothetical protein D3Y57_08710 [Sphingomonas paeninsulae]
MSRDVSNRLIRALSVYFGPLSAVDHRTSKWSSATFTGTRHMIWFDIGPCDKLGTLIQNLPEADLPMPGHFVADIELAERNDLPESVRLGLRALTIAEA